MTKTSCLFKRLATLAVLPTAMFTAPALAIVAIPCNQNPGICQTAPILPGQVNGPVWTFINPQSGRWFDPPTAVSFDIQVFGDIAAITRIVAPTGFDNLIIAVAGSPVNTDFDQGESHVFAPTVSKFNISGFNVDMANPAAFPLFMEFEGTVTSMTWTAELAPVPEPGTYAMMVLGLAGVLAAAGRARARSHR